MNLSSSKLFQYKHKMLNVKQQRQIIYKTVKSSTVIARDAYKIDVYVSLKAMIYIHINIAQTNIKQIYTYHLSKRCKIHIRWTSRNVNPANMALQKRKNNQQPRENTHWKSTYARKLIGRKTYAIYFCCVCECGKIQSSAKTLDPEKLVVQWKFAL